MELNEYQELAGRTSDKRFSSWRRLSNGCFGMCGEAGECIDLLKLEQVAKRNIEKLKARYPQGFEVDKSIHRREYER